jgi:hypothetical protein
MRWEYLAMQIEDSNLHVLLDSRGAMGWELVTAERSSTDRTAAEGQDIWRLIFKRPVEGENR